VASPEKNTEEIERENEYMEHILGLVKDHLHIDKKTALIDLELYLSKKEK
jgi:hypothetical protein